MRISDYEDDIANVEREVHAVAATLGSDSSTNGGIAALLKGRPELPE